MMKRIYRNTESCDIEEISLAPIGDKLTETSDKDLVCSRRTCYIAVED
jgi:hypothetical protein